jgi:flap endonuclease-1
MGVPVIDAPTEAEAQCAAMAKAGLVYGVATEDMDCLTFGAPRSARRGGGREGETLKAPALRRASGREEGRPRDGAVPRPPLR